MKALERYIEDYKQDPKLLDREQTEYMINQLIGLCDNNTSTETIAKLENEIDYLEESLREIESIARG